MQCNFTKKSQSQGVYTVICRKFFSRTGFFNTYLFSFLPDKNLANDRLTKWTNFYPQPVLGFKQATTDN